YPSYAFCGANSAYLAAHRRLRILTVSAASVGWFGQIGPNMLWSIFGLALGVVSSPVSAANPDEVWLAPTPKGIVIQQKPGGDWLVSSAIADEFTLESTQSYSARPGDAFEIKVRLKVGVYMQALPELVCYDAQGREIPIGSSLARNRGQVTTDWQALRRVFPTQPGTASVRARVRGARKGTLGVADLEFRPFK